jgi:N-glycosylase/DNA lyase
MIKIYNKDLNLDLTLLSGQCFRQIKNIDNSFDIILSDRVINIRRNNNYLIISSNNENNLETIVRNYFDLDTNYNKINKILISKDSSYENIIKLNKGFHILNQNKFEMYISYIISQNNNIKRISKIIENISIKYGKKIIFNNKEYYLFPKYEDLINITINDLNEFKLGFRDKYIINAINKLKENKDFLNNLDLLNTSKCLKELMKIKGIGMKVASCILLFSYHRLDVFPIDTWVKHFMSDRKVDIKDIKTKMKNIYGDYSGLIIQYIYNYERNIKNRLTNC